MAQDPEPNTKPTAVSLHIKRSTFGEGNTDFAITKDEDTEEPERVEVFISNEWTAATMGGSCQPGGDDKRYYHCNIATALSDSVTIRLYVSGYDEPGPENEVNDIGEPPCYPS